MDLLPILLTSYFCDSKSARVDRRRRAKGERIVLSRYKQRWTSVSVRFNRSLTVDRETRTSKLTQNQLPDTASWTVIALKLSGLSRFPSHAHANPFWEILSRDMISKYCILDNNYRAWDGRNLINRRARICYHSFFFFFEKSNRASQYGLICIIVCIPNHNLRTRTKREN